MAKKKPKPTQKQMATTAHLSQSFLSQVFSGDRGMDKQTARRVLEVMGESPPPGKLTTLLYGTRTQIRRLFEDHFSKRKD